MKILIFPLIGCMLMAFVFGQERIVTIPPMDIVLEQADGGFDLTASGTWFVQFKQDDWTKLRKTLYPIKADRTRAVSDAQAAFKSNLDAYVIEALKAGKYGQGIGTGVTLSARTVFGYIAVSFKNGEYCRVYVRESNKQYTLSLFDNLADETAAATTARANMVTQLGIIEIAADIGNFYEQI